MAVRVLEATKDVFELIFAEPQKAFFPKVFDDQAVFAKQRVYVNLPNLLVQVFGWGEATKEKRLSFKAKPFYVFTEAA